MHCGSGPCLILSEESENDVEVVPDLEAEEDEKLRQNLQQVLAQDHAQKIASLRGNIFQEFDLVSDDDECCFDDSLAILSWRDLKAERKKAKKEKKRLKKLKKKQKKEKAAKERDMGWAAALAQVQAAADPNARKKDKLTPKQRRRLRAIVAAEEAARHAYEEKARRAAEWRESRDKVSAEWGIMPKLRGARPKKKAKTKHAAPLKVQENKVEVPLAENTDAVAPTAIAVPDEDTSKKADVHDTDAIVASPSDAEQSEVERAASEESAVESEVDRDKSEEKKPSGKKQERRSKAKEGLKKLKAQMTEAMELASSGAFLDYELFDPRKAYEIAYGKRLEDESSSGSSDSGSESGNEDEKVPVHIEFDSEPPKELLTREQVGESAAAYIEHFIRYVMGQWKRRVASGTRIIGNGLAHNLESAFNSASTLKETLEALIPLLVQLRQKSIGEDMLKRIDSIVGLAADRDYAACIQEYMVITMGKKTWHQSLPQIMQQQNHGGAIARILKQSEFVDFDFDPVVKAYTIALKRVIQFAQWLHPPEFAYKGSYL